MKKRGLLIGVLLFACVAGMTASETAVAASRVRLCAERKDGTGMDTTYYQSFESARVQANKARRAEIQLLADAGFNGAAKIQSITTNLTIDLNGYRLGDSLCTSPNTVNLLYLNRDTISLTITSSRPGGRIFVARAHDGAICAVNCAAGHLTMEHVRVEVRNLAAASASNAGSRCVYMGAKGALEMNDCVLEAECSGKGAYGIYTNPYTLSLHRTDHAVVTHTRITASAKAYAYGICAKAHMDMAYDTVHAVTSLNAAYGFQSYCDTARFTAHHCAFTAEVGTATCYGAYVQKGRWESEDCFFRGVARQDTATVKANAITRAVAASIYAEMRLRRCTLEAKGWHPTFSRGIYTVSVNATSKLWFDDCSLRAEGAEDIRGFYGLRNDTTSTQLEMNNCSMYVRSSKNAYGIHTYPTTRLSHCRIDVQAEKSNCYGVYINYTDTIQPLQACASMEDVQVDVSSFKYAYSIYTKNNVVAERCRLTASADSSSAYPVYATVTGDSMHFHDCHLRANAPLNGYVVNKNSALEGKLYLHSGYFSERSRLRAYLPEGYGVYRLYEGAELQAGYPYTIRPISNPNTVVARLFNRQTGAHIADFNSLPAALWHTYFNDNLSYTIILTGDCALPWGTYLIPSYVTLVVGYKDDQQAPIGSTPQRINTSTRNPLTFARLVLEDDAEMIVDGELEVSALQQPGSTVTGNVSAEQGYGEIHLMPSATISVERGAQLRAWGYITGEGTIEAKAGATMYEFVQLGGWKGGTVTYEMLNNKQKVFPITHFFYQNIECPVIYHAGCKALGSTAVKIGEFMVSYNDMKLIDDSKALFVMDTTGGARPTVRKEYDPLTDRMTWTTNGNTTLDELSVRLDAGIAGNYSMVSTNYVLPLNTNMTIHVQSGTLEMKHDLMLPPGSVVEVGPQAQVHIPAHTRVFVYDADQYGIYRTEYSTLLPYSPSWKTCPRDTIPVDARVDISGEVVVDGALYTTDGGAAISGCDSVEGRVIFASGSQPTDTVYMLTGKHDDYAYTPARAMMAGLRNADSTYTATLKAKAGAIYTYSGGYWFSADTLTAEDTIPAVIPDTVPIDTLPDTVPTIEPDTMHSLRMTRTAARGRIILQNNQLYILLPDGRCYTLSGLPIKKDE